MTYYPVLFRAALTVSAMLGAAAPLAAQPLSSPISKSTVLKTSLTEASLMEASLTTSNPTTSSSTASIAKSSLQFAPFQLAQDPTSPPSQPVQVFPLPKSTSSPEGAGDQPESDSTTKSKENEPAAPASNDSTNTPPQLSPAPSPSTTPPTNGSGASEIPPPVPPAPGASPDLGTPPPPPPDGGAPTTPPTNNAPSTTPQPVPEAPPATPPAAVPPQPSSEDTTPQAPERQVLVSEVFVEGVPEGELTNQVYEAISTRPGQVTTRSQLQVDINAIFATGYFSAVRAEPSDTPLGVRVTFIVQPNPVLKSVQAAGNKVLTQEELTKIFEPQYGKILNLRDLQTGIKAVNKYYQDKGYVLGQVVGSPQVDADGTVTLQVAEGVIEGIDIRYKNKDGEPTKGKTRKFIITREMRTKPGDVLNRDRLQADLRTVFGLGLFEDVQVALEPGQDPRKVVVNLNVQEKKTGSLSFGGGFSSNSGLFGTANYTQNNLGGNNQKLNAQIQVGTREYLFDVSFTDPWIATDPYRTSYTVNLFNRLTVPIVFDGGKTDINVGDPDGAPPIPPDGVPGQVFADTGDTPRVNRLGAGVFFGRPLTKNPDKIAKAWNASAGLQYQRISIQDANFNIVKYDILGNDLSFSGKGIDDLFTVQLGLSKDLRNDPLTPTKGSVIRVGLDQAIPIGLGSINFTRLRASYSHFFPVKLLKFTKGPQALAFNIQAGTILGDLPPYEAFTLGGSTSVRGYDEGDVGSGRSFLQASAEYRFPLLKFLGGIGGVLFVDYGTLLGTQDDVPGSPGIVRGKPGDGLGYGVGVRVKTPLGAVRLDYGWNIDGESRFQFGIGERF